LLALNCTPATLPVSVTPRTRTERLLARLRAAGGEEGSSLIEFAVCLPVLMLILTGTFAFGIALNNYLMLTNATTIGAQQLSISREQTLDPCAAASAAVIAASPLLKPANLTFAYSLNGVAYTGTTCSSSSYTSGAAGNLQVNKSAMLTVTYPCNLAVYGANLVPNCMLKAQLTEMVQ
jgi:Flp pilus assembly protein TadG